ncbi:MULTISPECIES: DUF2059 domain-containing protein [Alkalimonas]|uniref:DUF2059 domain-containing protein n=1 Tax=Alkalimonas mucilaginosa TaxID=3057676 RepID=A0ABU7JKE9_9GAMM|nr:DUF2059 domain-containing protein [Alkalimonas sp. MEB004]MEE2025585.1 DUF2059 domain-containing protein [Alkalimonas sp. MEB004]
MLKKSILLAAMLCCFPLKADPAYELLDVMGGQEQVLQMQQQLVQMMAGSNPVLAQYEPVLLEWSRTYMSWDEMKVPMAALYKKHFSEAELKELVQFYKSPVGAKSVELMPQLFSEGAQIGMALAEKYQPQLLQMLEAAGLDIGN